MYNANIAIKGLMLRETARIEGETITLQITRALARPQRWHKYISWYLHGNVKMCETHYSNIPTKS